MPDVGIKRRQSGDYVVVLVFFVVFLVVGRRKMDFEVVGRVQRVAVDCQGRRWQGLRLENARGAGRSGIGWTRARAPGRGAEDFVDIEVQGDVRVVDLEIIEGGVFESRHICRDIEVGEVWIESHCSERIVVESAGIVGGRKISEGAVREGAVRRRVGERKSEGGRIDSGVRCESGGNGWRLGGGLGGVREEAEGGDCREKIIKMRLMSRRCRR